MCAFGSGPETDSERAGASGSRSGTGMLPSSDDGLAIRAHDLAKRFAGRGISGIHWELPEHRPPATR